MTKTQPPKQGPDFRPTARIDLKFPIQVSGVEVSHLIMRRPKVRDELLYSKASGADADRALALYASLTETPVEDLMELDSFDWAKLDEQFLAFKGARPQQPNSDGASSPSAG